MESGSSWSSQPYSTIYYAARERLYTNKSPSLECTSSDIIKEPVGLITADEVSLAGGIYGTSNTNYYLYTGEYYWMMTPFDFNSPGYAFVFFVNLDGTFFWNSVDTAWGVRPVINLKADTKFTGEGTVNSPFEVVP